MAWRAPPRTAAMTRWVHRSTDWPASLSVPHHRTLGVTSSTFPPHTPLQVLADPSVHAVYIPLPSALHLPWVRAAAAAGKHALLEKPAAVDAQELQAMLQACQAAGVQLMDGTMCAPPGVQRYLSCSCGVCGSAADPTHAPHHAHPAAMSFQLPPLPLPRSLPPRWMHNPRAARMAAVLRDAAQPLGRVQEVSTCFTFLGNEEFWCGNVRISGADPLGALGDLGERAGKLKCSARSA